MTAARDSRSGMSRTDWLIALLLVLCQCCLPLLFNRAAFEFRQWRPFATPTPTPIPIILDISSDDEAAARDAYYGWLREQYGLQATPDPDLEDRAYYLAGEAPRLRLNQQWPQWAGARYAVGPAAGQWTRYWEGGLPCQIQRRSSTLATFDLDGLPAADRVGAAVVWRNGEPYLAVVWPGMCPGPPVIPTFTNPGPTGPGW